jgi:hypothetical protein
MQNQKTGSSTKHIKVRCLSGGGVFQDRQVFWCFVGSAKNCSDGMTKKLPDKFLERASRGARECWNDGGRQLSQLNFD